VPSDHKAGLIGYAGEQLLRGAEVERNYASAVCAGDVMVVIAPTDPIMVHAVSKCNPIHQFKSDKCLNGAVDGGTAYMVIARMCHYVESIDGKVCPCGGERLEALRNASPGVRHAKTLVKDSLQDVVPDMLQRRVALHAFSLTSC
jgi:hypothetical protein